MKHTIEDIKLRHLRAIDKDRVDYNALMIDILGYKNTWWDRRVMFKLKFKKIYDLIKQISTIDISKLERSSDCKIRLPKNIDSLSYQARLELDQIRSKGSQDITDLMSKVIAITCLTTTHQVSYSSNSKLFESWKQYILNQPLSHMAGLYNDIEKALNESNKVWDQAFLQVQVLDEDYEAVNGQTYLSRFNTLNTIKKIVSQFRVQYEEAFLFEYRLIMTNNLEDASRKYVGELMRVHKERIFTHQRNQKNK